MIDREQLALLNQAAIECLVSINLVASVMDRYPEEVQENFMGKVEALRDNLVREMVEFADFGEAFDDHVEDQ